VVFCWFWLAIRLRVIRLRVILGLRSTTHMSQLRASHFSKIGSMASLLASGALVIFSLLIAGFLF